MGKAYRDEKKQRDATPPIEFCPECHSLKRKPNKECVNHDKYWIDKDQPTPQDTLKDTLKDAFQENHLIEITKEKKKYIVRFVGDYGDIVQGRNTAYEFSEVFKTFKEARECAKEKMENTRKFYEQHKRKAHIRLVEYI
jgi:hypothetical protein